jgi:hypothetical protein
MATTETAETAPGTIEGRLARCEAELEEIHRSERRKVDERTRLVWEARDDHGMSLGEIGKALDKPSWFAAKILTRPYPEEEKT